jgi:hypothetical protein
MRSSASSIRTSPRGHCILITAFPHLADAIRVILAFAICLAARAQEFVCVHPTFFAPKSPTSRGRGAEPKRPNQGSIGVQQHAVGSTSSTKIWNKRSPKFNPQWLPIVAKNLPILAFQQYRYVPAFMVMQRAIFVAAPPFVQTELPATPVEQHPTVRLRVMTGAYD